MKKLWQKNRGCEILAKFRRGCENLAKFHRGCKNPVSLYFLPAELPSSRNAPISCKNENKSSRNQNESKSNQDKTNLKEKNEE